MSYRTGARSDFEARDYTTAPRSRPPYDDDYYERRSETRSSQPRRAPVRDYEEVDISVRDRHRERPADRTPAFLRDEPRRPEAGAMVLRQREIETVDRRRPRSPSSSPSPPPQPATRIRERIIDRPRSLSPPRRHIHPRYVEPPADVRVEVDTRERRRSPSPDMEREREIRIIERERERIPSPSPSPPPPPPEPPVIRGPTLEREVITHYTDIDHGVIRAKRPSPPPPPPPEPRARQRERETDIDITVGRHETDIDIRHKESRSRSRPRQRPRPRARSSHYDEDIIIDTNHKHVEISEHNRRRAHSAAPPRPDYADEAEQITNRIDSRGRMGEAWHGATKDWTIVDVPPGTERVKMDGVGGGGAEVTWQRYNGVRRAQFIPERDGVSSVSSSSDPPRERERELSVQVYKSPERERSRDREVEIDEVHDRRITVRDSSKPPARQPKEMWTEITKDLVVREAIEQVGYDYEETEWFFYVMQYLRYEDVLELVNISDEIRRYRRHKARQLEYEREVRDEYRDEFDRRYHYHHRHRASPRHPKGDYEYELSYDRGPVGTYYR